VGGELGLDEKEKHIALLAVDTAAVCAAAIN